jgi:hypothetical protein
LFEFRRINDLFDKGDIFPEARTRKLTPNELNSLFLAFIITLEDTTNSQHYLNKLQTVFPEWDWKNNQNGFNPPLTIEDAIARVQNLSLLMCVVLLILKRDTSEC